MEPEDYDVARKRRLLTSWIEAHTEELRTALKPFAHNLYAEHGKVPEETVIELLNEVSARAIDKPENYDPTRPPFAWLLGIARIVVLQWRDTEIKWRTRYKNTPPGYGEMDGLDNDPFSRLLAASVPDPGDQAIGNIWVMDLLKAAPDTHREIVQTFIATGYDTAEVAERLSITAVTVRQRLVRARRWFAEQVQKDEGVFSPGGKQ